LLKKAAKNSTLDQNLKSFFPRQTAQSALGGLLDGLGGMGCTA
jgi:hypothetical protein